MKLLKRLFRLEVETVLKSFITEKEFEGEMEGRCPTVRTPLVRIYMVG